MDGEGRDSKTVGEPSPPTEPVVAKDEAGDHPPDSIGRLHEPKQGFSLKEHIERNPFVYIVTCIVAAVGVTSAIQQYFYSQESSEQQRKLDALGERLASIKRGLPDSEYLDVRKLIYIKGSSASEVPSGSAYFAEGSFYAVTAKDWEHSTSTELQLLADFTGIDLSRQIPNLGGALQALPIHLWRPKAKPIQISNAEPFKQIFPYILLESLTFSQLDKVLGLAVKGNDNGHSNPIEGASSDTKDDDDTLKGLEQYIRNDAVGSLFTMKLMAIAIGQAQVSNRSFTLLNVQKVGNVLYSNALLTFHDVKLDGKPYSEFYLRQEMIMIATPNGISLIQTLIPDTDPSFRDPASTAVTAWLQDFRVVVG